MKERIGLNFRGSPLLRNGLVFTVLLLAPRLLLASESARDFQHDPVEHHAARLVTWILGAGILIVAFAILRVARGQVAGHFAQGLLVLGVVLIPIVCVSIGMMLVFVRAERVEFCGSCHEVMDPHVADMKNPESEGLAAIHYKYRYIPSNQCYECHTSYGLFGTVQAKVSGIQEVLKYYTASYEFPLAMREPYKNADCLKCHSGSLKWQELEVHTGEGIEEALYEDRVSCMKCHGKTTPAHPVARREE